MGLSRPFSLKTTTCSNDADENCETQSKTVQFLTVKETINELKNSYRTEELQSHVIIICAFVNTSDISHIACSHLIVAIHIFTTAALGFDFLNGIPMPVFLT